MDLRDLRIRDLRQRISVMFQEPVRWRATVEENVWYGDVAEAQEPAAVAEALTPPTRAGSSTPSRGGPGRC